jgi:hypothetical protein
MNPRHLRENNFLRRGHPGTSPSRLHRYALPLRCLRLDGLALSETGRLFLLIGNPTSMAICQAGPCDADRAPDHDRTAGYVAREATCVRADAWRIEKKERRKD